jgi:hypothetical protein
MLSNEPICLSEDGLPAVNWADEEMVMSHAAFAALNSKKHLKLPAKRIALAAFADVKPTTMFSKLMPDDGSLVIKALEHLKITGKKEGDRHRFWNQIYVAGMLTRLFLLVCKNEKLLAVQRSGMGLRQRPQVHPAVTTLKKLVRDAIAKPASSALVESSNTQAGARIQDAVRCDPARADKEPCPTCQHFMRMEVDEFTQIESTNVEAKAKHDAAVKAWTKENPKARAQKP